VSALQHLCNIRLQDAARPFMTTRNRGPVQIVAGPSAGPGRAGANYDRSPSGARREAVVSRGGKAPRDFLVGRLLDASAKDAGGVSALQHSSIATPVT